MPAHLICAIIVWKRHKKPVLALSAVLIFVPHSPDKSYALARPVDPSNHCDFISLYVQSSCFCVRQSQITLAVKLGALAGNRSAFGYFDVSPFLHIKASDPRLESVGKVPECHKPSGFFDGSALWIKIRAPSHKRKAYKQGKKKTLHSAIKQLLWANGNFF